MPRSDDWTIHMRPALIKRAGPARHAASHCRQRPQPGLAKHCHVSVNRFKNAMNRIVLTRFRRREYGANFFLGMMTALGVLRFDRSPAGDKQLKYSLK